MTTYTVIRKIHGGREDNGLSVNWINHTCGEYKTRKGAEKKAKSILENTTSGFIEIWEYDNETRMTLETVYGGI